MASIGHVMVGMAAGRLYAGSGARLATVMFRLSALSMLPDADVIGMALGIPYGAPFGHRGATHSLVAACVVGLACGVSAWVARVRAWRVLLFATVVTSTHGLLDALTDGGLGVAHFWPFSTTRHFFRWTPIPVAPIGRGLLSAEGLRVVSVELVYFAPLLVYALWPRPTR
jgi:inner membrane protein